MEILVSTHQLSWIGGADTYLVTVAEPLQRLGDEVTIYALETGDMAEVAQGRGLRVVPSEQELPDEVDVIFAQESVTSLLLAERYPHTPQAYSVQFGRVGPLGAPAARGRGRGARRPPRACSPAGPGRSLSGLRSFACQPVDTQRFAPRGPLREVHPRVLLLGNYVSGTRLELVESACRALGYECTHIGFWGGSFTTEPESAIGGFDIVVGKARAIVEAMACGRAAYVYDHNGGDGWVTPERYEHLEADNFGGQADGIPITHEPSSRISLPTDPRWGRRTATWRSPTTARPSTRRSSSPCFSVLRRGGSRSSPRSARWPGSSGSSGNWRVASTPSPSRPRMPAWRTNVCEPRVAGVSAERWRSRSISSAAAARGARSERSSTF